MVIQRFKQNKIAAVRWDFQMRQRNVHGQFPLKLIVYIAEIPALFINVSESSLKKKEKDLDFLSRMYWLMYLEPLS